MQCTEKQIKMFFALGYQLHYEPEVIKEYAKKKFNLNHLPEATKE
jgi:hypothetical protein